jgi:hypothetical protein
MLMGRWDALYNCPLESPRSNETPTTVIDHWRRHKRILPVLWICLWSETSFPDFATVSCPRND